MGLKIYEYTDARENKVHLLNIEMSWGNCVFHRLTVECRNYLLKCFSRAEGKISLMISCGRYNAVEGFFSLSLPFDGFNHAAMNQTQFS